MLENGNAEKDNMRFIPYILHEAKIQKDQRLCKKKNTVVSVLKESMGDFLQMQEWENFTESKSISNPQKEAKVFDCVKFLHSKICCK